MASIKETSTADLLSTLAQLERVTPNSAILKLIRKELFKRGVDNFNGIPLATLLRNPVLKAEYDAAMKEE